MGIQDNDDEDTGGAPLPVRVIEPGQADARASDRDDDDDDQDDGDEGAAAAADGGPEPEGDELLGARAEVDEDQEENVGGDRRESSISRRERQRRAKERDRRELAFLRKRNEDLERRIGGVENVQVQTQYNQVNARLAELDRNIALADEVLAEAVSSKNGDDFAKATKIRDKLIADRAQVAAIKARAEANVVQRQQAPAAPQTDPDVENHAANFMAKHKWIDKTGKDEDSAILLALDNAVLRDGFDPKTEEYWAELESRMERRLPHRMPKKGARSAAAAGDEVGAARSERQQRQSSGPRMPAGGNGRAPNAQTFVISAERKQAMIDANVWEDKVLREKYIRNYMKWDAEEAKASKRAR